MNVGQMSKRITLGVAGLAIAGAGLLVPTTASADTGVGSLADAGSTATVSSVEKTGSAAGQATVARASSSVRSVSGTGPGGKYSCKVDATIWSLSGTCAITDTKKDGKGVYLQVKGDRPYTTDTAWYRGTANGKGYGYVTTFKGTFLRVPAPVDRYEVRLCKDIRNTQDKCGSAKYVYR